MPPFTYEYKNDIFYVKDVAAPTNIIRAHYPEDAQNRPAAVVFGFEYATGKFIPISCTPAGKLDTTATLTGTVTIADVTITDKLSALDLSIAAPGNLATLITGGFGLMGKREDGNLSLLSLDNSDLLKVKLDGDIQIGAVELKNHNTDDRAKINTAGGLSIDDSAMQKQNMSSAYSYITVGSAQKVQTIKEYPTGAAGGAPAKLTTFTWNPDGTVATISTTDTTV